MSRGAVYVCTTEDAPAGPYRGEPKGHGWSAETLAKVLACPREAEHQYGPSGYVDWHEWADKCRKARWKQSRCACELWLILEGSTRHDERMMTTMTAHAATTTAPTARSSAACDGRPLAEGRGCA